MAPAESVPRRETWVAGFWRVTIAFVADTPASAAPLVAVIMGSSSDWETMKHAVEVLERFEIPHERHIVSAHRTPVWMAEFATAAEQRDALARAETWSLRAYFLLALAGVDGAAIREPQPSGPAA